MRVGKDEKCCINCAILQDKYRCEECRFEHKDHPSLFYRITRSPEAMAEKLVYRDEDYEPTFTVVVRGTEQRMGHECWRSTIIPGDCWAEYDRAYAATVEKLKEVYSE